MAQSMDDVIYLCCEIAGLPKFKNTWKNIRKGLSITTVAIGLGGLLFGPPGLAFGGAAGGLLSWLWTRGQFKSAPQILMELSHAERPELDKNIVAALGNLTWTDAAHLVAIVMMNPTLRKKVTDVLQKYFKKKV